MPTETTRCTIDENDMSTVPIFYYIMYNSSVTTRLVWPLLTPFYRFTIETKLNPRYPKHSFTSSNHHSNLVTIVG